MITHRTIIKCDGHECAHEQTIGYLAEKKILKESFGWTIRSDGATFCGKCRDEKKHRPSCAFCGTNKALFLEIDPMDYGMTEQKTYFCSDCYNERLDDV